MIIFPRKTRRNSRVLVWQREVNIADGRNRIFLVSCHDLAVFRKFLSHSFQSMKTELTLYSTSYEWRSVCRRNGKRRINHQTLLWRLEIWSCLACESKKGKSAHKKEKAKTFLSPNKMKFSSIPQPYRFSCEEGRVFAHFRSSYAIMRFTVAVVCEWRHSWVRFTDNAKLRRHHRDRLLHRFKLNIWRFSQLIAVSHPTCESSAIGKSSVPGTARKSQYYCKRIKLHVLGCKFQIEDEIKRAKNENEESTHGKSSGV